MATVQTWPFWVETLLDGTAVSPYYTSPFGYSTWESGTPSSEGNKTAVIPAPCTGQNLYIKLTVAPGVGKSWTFAILKNGTPTSLTVTLTGTSTVGHSAATVLFAAGDEVTLRADPTNTPANTHMAYTWQTVAVATSTSIYPHAWEASAIEHNSTQPLFITADWRPPVQGGMFDLSSASGQFTLIRIELDTAPGVGNTYTFTLYKNEVATVHTLTITGAATEAIWTGAVTAAGGDKWNLLATITGTPSASTKGRTSVVFVADQDGRSQWGASLRIASGDVTYATFPSSDDAPTSLDENDVYTELLAPVSITLANLYAKTKIPGGFGNLTGVTIRVNQADSSLSTPAAASGGEDLDGLAQYSQRDQISLAWSNTFGPGVRETVVVATMVSATEPGVIGPYVWVEWPRRVPDSDSPSPGSP
jgi:hypothetical protein